MAEDKSYNDIRNTGEDWEFDERNKLPYSGKSVQTFIKKGIDKADLSYEERIGDSYFDSSTYTIYLFKSTSDKEAWLGGDKSIVTKRIVLDFAGTQRQMKVINYMDGVNVYFTTAADKAEITFGFLSQKKDITGTDWETVPEDALISVSVDKGGVGEFVDIVSNQLLLDGERMTVDVKKYIATGSNRVRVTAVGASTGAEGKLLYQVNLTTMYLSPSNFAWNIPFIEGQAYNLGGMNIGGAINKKLFVKVTNENGYYKLYEKNIGTSTYITNAYFFNGMEFPSQGTGVYNVELWLDASGLESEHLSYNIICVSQADETTAKLVCISNLAATAINYADNTLFQYAVYNGGAAKATPHIKVTAVVNTNPIILKDEDLIDVDTATRLPYNFHLEVETDENDLQLTSTLTFGNKQVRNFVIDNSASFPATSGASFYLNAANRSNEQANKKNIINEVTKGTIACDWKNMVFDSSDGWTTDDEGRKCLLIPAGSRASIHYQPLSAVGTGKTIEFNFKVKNAADYSDPIITVCDDPSDAKFRGIRILPKKVVLHSRDKNTADYVQGYDFMDEQYVNMLITIIRNYKTNYGNIATIYVNGAKKCSFEFENADSFDVPANIILGNSTADLYLYTCRVYESGFGFADSQKNYVGSLNTSKDKADAWAKMNNILDDSYKVNYDKVFGIYNTMVIEMLDGAELPHYGLSKEYSANCNLELNILNEDEDKPTISGIYKKTPIGGQGTTSMNYFRWNLRTKKTPIRLTAKKNYASSMQSHKMGACGAYNDLHDLIVGQNEAGAMVAVYQYPVFGFLKTLVDGTTDQYTYEFIGMFTVGPDKGDKGTFGYNGEFADTVISMEGTDHSIKGVGFDYPYKELRYEASKESLCVDRGSEESEAAWEVSVCGDKSSESDIQAYLDEEFEPAYKCAYDNSVMIMGTSESISTINADVNAWGLRTDASGRPYQHFEFWIDGEYDIYYLSRRTNTYVKNGTNLLTQLGLTASDVAGKTIEEKNELFISKRVERFRASAGNFFNTQDILFSFAFLMIFGVSDNFKKNSYPYKLRRLADGGRWCYRQDDMDTLGDIDNQNLSTKTFSIELPDFTDETKTAYVYKGENSVLLQNVLRAFPAEFKQMGKRILAGMYELSGKGTDTIERLTGFFDKYFWDKAQNYFPKSAYNIDAEYSYEEAWPPYKKGNYVVDVHPLEQSRGDHYEAERDWFVNRMIYCASKFGYGPFAQYNDSALGVISFRTQLAQDFTLTPAIDLYPTIHSGQSAVLSSSERIKAGESVSLNGAGGTNTNVYIKGADLLTDIGDLKTLSVDAANASISVASKRLQRLKIGDENAESVTSNLASVNMGECPSLMLVDARNLASLTGTFDLSQCPRIREAYFGGTDVRAITLANGSKITRLQLSDVVTQISMQNLKFLDGTGLEKGDLSNVEFFRVENCEKLDAFGMLKELYYCKQETWVEQLTEDMTTSPCTLGSSGEWYLGSHNECHVCVPLKAGEQMIIDVLEAGTIPSYAFLASYNPPYSTGTKIPFATGETGRHIISGSSVTVTAPAGTNYIAFTIIDGNGAGYKYRIQTKQIVSTSSALKNIRVIGFVYDGDATDVDMISNIAKDIDASGASKEFTGIDSDGNPQPTMLPVIEGTLNVVGSVFQDSAEFVMDKYPNLVLNVTGGYYIRFADSAVAAICATNWGDGIGITEAQAAAVTTIDTKFKENTEITSFDELEKFTGVTQIASRAFYGCTSLKTISLSNIVTLTNGANFKNDNSLSIVVNMPKLTGVVPYGAFENTAITGIENLGEITTIQGNDNVNVGGYGNYSAFRKCTELKFAKLPSTLKEIQYASFAGCTSLESITFDDASQITTIGIGAFYKVPWDGELNFPNLTGTLSYASFQETAIIKITNLGKITTISGTANNIGPYGAWGVYGAFRNCVSLVSVVFPDSLTTLMYGAFYGCTSLEIDDLILPNLTSIDKNVFYGVKIKKASNLGKITSIPHHENGDQFLGDKSTLQEVTLPSTLTTIGDSAFYGYSSLIIEDLSLPNLTSLGANAFYGVKIIKISNLGSITALPKTYDSSQNYGSKSVLKEVVLPSTITQIVDYSFYKYTALTKVDILWDVITYIGTSAFDGCTSLIIEELSLPNITQIYNYAFRGVTVKRITNLGSAITIIRVGCFYNSKNLTYVNIPAQVTDIYNEAFRYCTSLVAFICNPTTPPTLSSTNAFSNTPIASGTGYIYVPDESVDAYKSAWSTYAGVIKPLSEYVEE